MSRRPRSVLIAVLLLFLWIVPLTAAGGSAGLPAWGTEPSPNAGFPRNVLEGVDAVSATDAWAVGSFEANGSNHPRPLAERWNGTEWTSVQIPWNDEGELFGVAARASSDVWAVGGNQNGGQAVIAHWNGSDLSLVSHPNPGTFNRLYAVTALAANDVVGGRRVHEPDLEDPRPALERILVGSRPNSHRRRLQPPVRRHRARPERRVGGRRRRKLDARPALGRIAVDTRADTEPGVLGGPARGLRSAGRDRLGGG